MAATILKKSADPGPHPPVKWTVVAEQIVGWVEAKSKHQAFGRACLAFPGRTILRVQPHLVGERRHDE